MPKLAQNGSLADPVALKCSDKGDVEEKLSVNRSAEPGGKLFNAAEETLRKSIEKKTAEKHPSTIYPPMWMPDKTWTECAPGIIAWLATIAGVMLTAWISSDSLSTNTTVAVAVMIVAVPIRVCWSYSFEYTAQLNFRGVQMINLGAFVNLVLGAGNFTRDFDARGLFAGTSLLTAGAIIFAYTTYILGPVEFMTGTPFLAAGLLLRSCATFIALRRPEHTLVVVLSVASCPFFFVSLGFLLVKSFKMMHRPWLSNVNFKFFGIFLFGAGVLCSTALSIWTAVRGETTGVQLPGGAIVASIGAALTFFGTSLILLDSARAKDHCEAVIEDRYPSTTNLIRSRVGFMTAHATSVLGAVAAATAMTANLVSPPWTESGKGAAPRAIEFATCQGIALAALALALAAIGPSIPAAWARHEGVIVKQLALTTGAFTLFGLGTSASGAAAVFDADNASGVEVARGVALAGALALCCTMFPRSDAPSRIDLLGPMTWDKIHHPANYMLLAGVWLAVGAACKVGQLHALGDVAYVWAFLVLLLQWCMAEHAWESMNLEADADEAEAEEDCPVAIPNAFDLRKRGLDKSDKDVDVVISGGGITGLMLSCVLGKAGVSVVLAEISTTPVTDARFAIVNSSSMEYIADVLDPDLLAEFLALAVPGSSHFGSMLISGLGHPDAQIWKAANSPSREKLMDNLSDIDDWTESRIVGSRFSSILPVRIMQSHQESILKKQIKRYPNVEIKFGCMLNDFHVSDEVEVVSKLVDVKRENDDGDDEHAGQRTEVVRSKYIIGCDGPSSTVAKVLQFKFDGLLNLARTRSLLTRAPGLYEKVMNSIGNTHQYQIIRKNYGLAGLVAIDPPRDLWNFVVLFGDKPRTAPPAEVAAEFLGTDNFEIVQDRSWYWNFFVARNFRMRKRAFLVGDAAHSWPPFGGIGGNSSYGDAVNLGWKLAAACRSGGSSELLLESYSIERRQHVMQTAMFVMRATPRPELLNVLTSPMFQSPWLRPWVGAMWYYRNSGTHSGNHFSQSGIQLGIKLNFSPVIVREELILPDDPSCEYTPAIRSGARLPFLPLADGTTLFSNLDPNGFTLLVVARASTGAAEALAAAVRSRGLAAVVVPVELPPLATLRGANRHVAGLLVLEAIVVVRPDHTIAYRATATDAQLLDTARIDAVAATLTGRTHNGASLAGTYQASPDAKTMASYHRWLTRQFKFNLRPYKFMFPVSIPVMNTTKEEAISLAKAKKNSAGFSTTTKQGVELVRLDKGGNADPAANDESTQGKAGPRSEDGDIDLNSALDGMGVDDKANLDSLQAILQKAGLGRILAQLMANGIKNQATLAGRADEWLVSELNLSKDDLLELRAVVPAQQSIQAPRGSPVVSPLGIRV